ncbi:DNA methylase [Desulfosarcina alkanivorans]|uniref:DNA methylase n=2 Tax=Desulfosarcina alkanivorans TaxID=571177 RepID=A0A5K7YBL1_9BACT|nr:DNA methylase [Desulfosarcina alkanivorans]
MAYWGESHLQKCSTDSYLRFNKITRTPHCLDDAAELRKVMLDFIADFANWDNSTDPAYLAVARTLTVAAHYALEDNSTFALPESISVESLNDAIKDAPRPLLVDPFAGGGAIPLEGLRCGADAFASDLNPVAVLLNKVVLEYIPKYGQRLADEVEKWGQWIKEQAEKELAEFYPKDEDGATPIAYLWARTITCEGPGCGAEVPLMRSLWLAKKGEKSIAVQIVPKPDEKRCDFVIIKKENGNWVYQDKPEMACEKPKFDATVARGSATCPCCGFTTPVKSVRAQLKPRKGGANDARLFAVVTTRPGQKGRFYRLPGDRDLDAIRKSASELERRKAAYTGKHSFVPEEPTPPGIGSGAGRAFSQRNYGIDTFSDLYTPRQLLSMTTLSRLVQDCSERTEVQSILALGVGRVNDLCMSNCRWLPTRLTVAAANGGQNRMPVNLDFAETVAIASASGSWQGQMKWINNVVRGLVAGGITPATVQRVSAQTVPLPTDSVDFFFTDPPYYDAFPYSDLSDFFYIWTKRALSDSAMDYDGGTVPKSEEIVLYNVVHGEDGVVKDHQYFQEQMSTVFSRGRDISKPNSVGTIVFANKTTEGWEALVTGLIDSGWIVTGSWPIQTERPSRQRAQESAALGSSVHIVCRPREDEDGNVIERVGDWRDVLSELPGRIADWLPRLASEGVVGADAIFACLGPALEIFSRYSSVEKASGEVVPLREYLEQIWAEVARQALNMIFEGANASGFEEDARLTAMWLWTLRTEANGNGADNEKATSLPGYTLEYDAARKIAQGLGCHLENLTHLVEVKGDKAMLLSAESRARYLFGKEDVRATTKRCKKKDGPVQQDLFSLLGVPDEEETVAERAELERPPAGKTALDQLHQAMLLFTAGRGAALKRFLVDDGIGTNPQFWTLAQALSALYPSHTNEKRWVDGVLARKKGLGF